MTIDTAETKSSNDLELEHPDYASVQRQISGTIPTDEHVLDCLLGNPRFSKPANDAPDLSQVAPRRQDCREAKLLSMWIDILAEAERAGK